MKHWRTTFKDMQIKMLSKPYSCGRNSCCYAFDVAACSDAISAAVIAAFRNLTFLHPSPRLTLLSMLLQKWLQKLWLVIENPLWSLLLTL